MEFTTLSVQCPDQLSDVLIAELFELGFDSFQEFEGAFEASCENLLFSESQINALFERYPAASFSIKQQEKVNWNEEWEKNYDPIIVDDICLVRATFHVLDKNYEYEIVVNPKMSFGTGHHATTYQMLSFQMELDHEGKKVLDVGSGTGILAIMASKRRAQHVTATDIDDWCIENSLENFSLNKVENVEVIKGQIDQVKENDFDIIIANINKNVLLDQLKQYTERLKQGGYILLSGFYQHDVSDLMEKAISLGLTKVKETEKEKWAMLALTKPSS